MAQGNLISAAPDLQAIGTVMAIEELTAAPAPDQRVIAFSAERLGGIAVASDQAVVARFAIKVVTDTAATHKRVIAKAAKKPIDKAIAQDAVIATTAPDVFNPRQAVIASRAGTGARAEINRDRAGGAGIAGPIRAKAADQSVIPGAAEQNVVADTAIKEIIIGAAQQGIITVAALQLLTAAPARD